MSDVICIVAFRVNADRTVRYKKVMGQPTGTTPITMTTWIKVAEVLRAAYEKDKADFVSIRFIRQPKSEGERG